MSEKPRSRGGRSALSLGFLSVLSPSDVGFVGGYLILNGVGRPLEFHCTTPVKPSRAQEILYGNSLKPYLFAEQIAPALVAKVKTPVAMICVDRWELLDFADSAGTPVAAVMPEAGGGLPVAPHFLTANHGGLPEPVAPADAVASRDGGVATVRDGDSSAGWPPSLGAASHPDAFPTAASPVSTIAVPAAILAACPRPAPTSEPIQEHGRRTPNGIECWQGRFGRTMLICAAHHAPAVGRLLSDWAAWTDALDLSEPFERIRAAIEEALRRG
ncbi:MAG: hypothetical protein ACUVQQ_09330 [Thermogutta sp.]